MPLSYHIDEARGLLSLKGSGSITADDIDAYVEEVLEDPRQAYVTQELADFRDAEFSVTPDRVVKLAALDRKRLSRMKIVRRAIVVSNDLQYGLARMYGQFLAPSGQEVRPFHDIDEARRWLETGEDGEDA
jgi:hypothetical protein